MSGLFEFVMITSKHNNSDYSDDLIMVGVVIDNTTYNC